MSEITITPTPPPTNIIVTAKPEKGLAVIDSAETILRNTFPVEVALIVRGNLPDDCTILDQRTQTRNGNAFSLELTTLRDPNANCTEALVPFEEQFELDVLDLKAGTYTVTINGIVQTFVLTNDNSDAPPTPIPPTPSEATPLFSLSGSVFHDLCAVIEATEDAEAAPTAGCVEDVDGGFIANGQYEEDEPPLIG
ncbi:MAG TPA: hypothetical protein ENJ56_01560, partial [Anaerolineae bacterium]|nr:hypothetical protein [Anaerolineae bacterium]